MQTTFSDDAGICVAYLLEFNLTILSRGLIIKLNNFCIILSSGHNICINMKLLMNIGK